MVVEIFSRLYQTGLEKLYLNTYTSLLLLDFTNKKNENKFYLKLR